MSGLTAAEKTTVDSYNRIAKLWMGDKKGYIPMSERTKWLTYHVKVE